MNDTKRALKKLWPLFIVAALFVILSVPSILPKTKYIDPSPSNIQEAISIIEANSTSDYEKILNTATYINQRVAYKVIGEACLEETASQVLAQGYGDCVSTSKLAAAILTGMEIPVQIVEGCVFNSRQYLLERTAYVEEFSIPRDEEVKDPYKTAGEEGQLHNWIRAYDGEQWYSVETTAGVIFPVAQEPLYGYNRYGGVVNPYSGENLCLLLDHEYVAFCKNQEEGTP